MYLCWFIRNCTIVEWSSPTENIYAVDFTSQEYIKVCDHLLLPSSRLWNAYIQFRGCDWWGDSKDFIPTAEKGPPINQRPLWGATQINKEGFFSSVAGRTVWEALKKWPLSFTLSYIHIQYIHITQAAFTPHGCAGRKRVVY